MGLEERVAELEAKVATLAAQLPRSPGLELGGMCRGGRHFIATEDDRIWKPSKRAFTCRACEREAQRRYRERKRAERQ